MNYEAKSRTLGERPASPPAEREEVNARDTTRLPARARAAARFPERQNLLCAWKGLCMRKGLQEVAVKIQLLISKAGGTFETTKAK